MITNDFKHRYAHRWFDFGDRRKVEKDDVRWTRTSGPEWDALMEQARHSLDPVVGDYWAATAALRAVLSYLGETK